VGFSISFLCTISQTYADWLKISYTLELMNQDTPYPQTPSPVPVVPQAVEPLPAPVQAPRDHKSNLVSIVSTILVLLLAPFIALLLTQFVFQSYQVDGQSMQPTLLNNDRLIVLKAPRTWARLTGHSYIPARGDVIIFSEPNLIGLDNTSQPKDLVKRVIGLPGDHVVIKDGSITVYDKQHPNGFDPDKTLSYGKAIPFTSGNIDITVPIGDIYVCGDNRGNSYDSRIFGPVPAGQIVGKLVLRVLPLNSAKKF